MSHVPNLPVIVTTAGQSRQHRQSFIENPHTSRRGSAAIAAAATQSLYEQNLCAEGGGDEHAVEVDPLCLRRKSSVHRIGSYTNRGCATLDDEVNSSLADNSSLAYWMPPPPSTVHKTSTGDGLEADEHEETPLQVDFRCACFKLSNISTVDFTTIIKFVVVFEWNDPRLCGMPFTTNDLPSDLWGPDIVLENAQSELEIIYDSFSLLCPSTGRLKRTVTFHGPIYNPMSLHDFPFDSDELELRFISISNWRTLNGIRFGNDPIKRIYTLEPMLHRAGVEFFFLGWGGKVSEFSILGWSQDVQNPLDDPSQPILFKFDIHLARKPTFYYLKILLPLWLIVLTSLAPYAVDTDDLQGRLEVLVTLLLSAIAFLYIVQESLPKKSQLTVIDKVVISSLVSLVLAVLFSVLISISPIPETLNWILALVNQLLYWVVNLALVGPPHYRHKKYIADMEARQALTALSKSGRFMPGMLLMGKRDKNAIQTTAAERRRVKLAQTKSYSMSRTLELQGDHVEESNRMLGFGRRFSIKRKNIDVPREQRETLDEINVKWTSEQKMAKPAHKNDAGDLVGKTCEPCKG